MQRAARVCAAAVLLALAGCAADRPKPTPLETVAPKIAARQAWASSIGRIDFPLVAAAHEGVFHVANGKGDVLALQADSGAELWRASVGSALSAGVGSDGRFTSVVTRGNEVVTFDSGREVWRKRVPSSVVTPPLVAGERVFVMGVDRIVHAFDALDGRRLWVYAKPGEPLTLSQASVIMPLRSSLLVAQAQRLTALDPLRGTVLWEVPMASPRGSNEVERLADLIGPATRVGDRICARAFQSAVACADASRGALLWSRNAGGAQAVAASADFVIGGDASDRITAWRASSGDVAWQSEKLLYRGLSGALALGPSVVFGDAEGYLHFLAAASGEMQLRLPTDGKPVIGAPVLAGTTMLVVTQGGGLFAFRPN
ncbi:MAG: outer membrane protein assembly factor BamB [Leptothrix sp. (in: Bacteria)]|nr:outer membrane protein assembly factor BamB [Leptothrix sp. (in: b-proteobacteria)]